MLVNPWRLRTHTELRECKGQTAEAVAMRDRNSGVSVAVQLYRQTCQEGAPASAPRDFPLYPSFTGTSLSTQSEAAAILHN